MKPATRYAMHSGHPAPMGATPMLGGVNFAVYSENAAKIELCLFDAQDREIARLALSARTGAIWHIFVGGLGVGTKYGYRVYGEYDPAKGHRFNPNKLLIDPYSKILSRGIANHDVIFGYDRLAKAGDMGFDHRDSAPFVPKSIVTDIRPLPHARPKIDPTSRVIYEAHPKGVTQEFPGLDDAVRGRYAGLVDPKFLAHLHKLGVTTIELLPVHAPFQEGFLLDRGLRNYWGYQTINFFTPNADYAQSHDAPGEFQRMVKAMHEAGFEVVLDVVYNHTGEGDELGPTLSFRGFDNAGYYRLADDRRYFNNDAGTGNTLDLTNRHVLRMVMDSMRYWVEVMGVDGFRFDLGTILAREPHGFDRNGGFFDALLQDPVLSQAILIAEPWDLGWGGYQCGNWPSPFLEWNDRFRDDVRGFWRNDPNLAPGFSEAITGSSLKFDHSHRDAQSSVNFVTAHDGFTLRDLVSYRDKHNEANQEGNRDGHNNNISDNFGVEGPTRDALINHARAQRMRNLLATVLLSQGTPMILAGDEIGNSQSGNNNSFAQDNPIGWVNWGEADWDMADFTARLIALRRENPLLRQRRFLHGAIRPDGTPDIAWFRPDGQPPEASDWQSPNFDCFGLLLRASATRPDYVVDDGQALIILINRGARQKFTLPKPPKGMKWQLTLSTAEPKRPAAIMTKPQIELAAASLTLLTTTTPAPPQKEAP